MNHNPAVFLPIGRNGFAVDVIVGILWGNVSHSDDLHSFGVEAGRNKFANDGGRPVRGQFPLGRKTGVGGFGIIGMPFDNNPETFITVLAQQVGDFPDSRC